MQIEKEKQQKFLQSVRSSFDYDDEVETSDTSKGWHRENFEQFLHDNE